jgi:4-hydroxybenzoate polyprenyltransferase
MASRPLGGVVSPVATIILWGAVVGVALMLLWEHRLVKADDLSKVDAAFFTMNGFISLGFFMAVFMARMLADR